MISHLLRAAFLIILFCGNSFAQQWYLSPVYHGRDIYSVAVLDRINIVSAGGHEQNDSLQEIFKSATGGMTWDFSDNEFGSHIRSLDFIDDAQNGLAVG